MKSLSVIGTSNSGKTTTVEAIIKELRYRGYTVGTVKEIHFAGFKLDTPGSDTDRHHRAGSAVVTARGISETDVLFDHPLSIEEISSFYKQDYLVLEGVRDANVPKIITAHNEQEVDERLDDSVFAIAGVISNQRKEYKGRMVLNSLTDVRALVDLIEKRVPDRLPNLPNGVCTLCGINCQEMMRQIIRGEKERRDCLMDHQIVHLQMGGQEIMLPLSKCLDYTIKELLTSQMFFNSAELVRKDQKV